MHTQETHRDQRQQELETLAKSNPEEIERLFHEYFPQVALPTVGSMMVQSIIAHEFDIEPARFQG